MVSAVNPINVIHDDITTTIAAGVILASDEDFSIFN
jgi:hypothetical protein